MSCLTIKQKKSEADYTVGNTCIYIPDCIISLASFVLDFHSLLIDPSLGFRLLLFCKLVLASKIDPI